MGGCFSCCFNFKDPPTAIISGSTSSESETQRLAARISNDQSSNGGGDTIFRFRDLPILVSVPDRTRVNSEGIASCEGTSNSQVIEQHVEISTALDRARIISERIALFEGTSNSRVIGQRVEVSTAPDRTPVSDGISSSEGTSNSRVAEQRVAVSAAPDRIPVSDGISSSGGTSNSRVAEQRLAVSAAPERTPVADRISSSGGTSNSRVAEQRVAVSRAPERTPIADRISSSEGISDTRVAENNVAVSVRDRTLVAQRISPSEVSNSFVAEPSIAPIIPQENKGISSSQAPNMCSEKHLLPPYNEFYEVFLSSEDEDVCPTCLEDYDHSNPKITTECSHHFHLSCIYAWMERSSTCPVCSRVMVFDEAA